MSTNKLTQSVLGIIAGWITIGTLIDVSISDQVPNTMLALAMTFGIVLGQTLTKGFALAVSGLSQEADNKDIRLGLTYANLFLFSSAAPGALWAMTDIMPVWSAALVTANAAWTIYSVVYKSSNYATEV